MQYTPSAGDDVADNQLRALLPEGFQLSTEMLGNLKEYNYQVDAIAMDDAIMLSDAMTSDHRNYDLLSERLLLKTRGQLQRTRRMYAASSAMAGGDRKELLSDLNNLFQGQYGSFITNLFRTKVEYNTYQLESALTGLGCDEDLIIDILCACPQPEFKEIQAAVTDEKNETYGIEVFDGKLIAGSVLQKFILKILRGTRHEEGRLPEPSVIIKQVADLIEFKTMIDVDGMLDLLCTASRLECEAINKKMYLQHFMTLPAYIKAVVHSSNAARALTLWTLPGKRAVLHSLHHGIYGSAYHSDDHSIAVCRIVASIDKRDISEVHEEYHRVYNKKLFDELSIFLIGNIKTALEMFISQPGFDNGFEKRIIACVHEAAEGELADQLLALVEEEVGLLKHYRSKSETLVAQAKMRILNGSQPVPNMRSSMKGIQDISLPPIAVFKRSPTKRSLQEQRDQIKATAAAEAETNTVAGGGVPAPIETEDYGDIEPPNLLPYLVDLYEANHPNEEGEIPVENFWKMIMDDVFRHVFTDYDVKQLKVPFVLYATLFICGFCNLHGIWIYIPP